ncbi:hypothetical protein V8E53_006091 [Lactarius tabidus]
MATSAPPVRRAPKRGVPSTALPPRARPALAPALTNATHSVEASGPLLRSSGAAERIANEDSFNGALYSLKAFIIATALVAAGGATSTYAILRITADTEAHARTDPGARVRDAPDASHKVSAPRLAHRSSYSAPLPPPTPLLAMTPPASGPDAGPPPLPAVMPEADGWTWPAAQARLAAAYEHRGVTRFAETVAEVLEAEAELERRKRGFAVSSQTPIRS